MRKSSAEVLRRVEAGESLQVSNRGRVVAVIVPAGADPLDSVIARGAARPAKRGLTALRDIRRGTSSTSTAELLADARGRW
ncbi:type II toxin-antitoxin system Phd/YefM family antitoxin [Flexivirga caeni]|uniref:Type II toxin-antitoxin system prevent-host-death family antitoxin n=1 Tax=Flexivirga caeni TaxID=2294115 RepID=A0A3M9LXY3_9MICO|nr:type II toxin-antitoxin system prevent-host-death family antitoxin [Flexivirga caeni]RNI18144.1 type II toxin-antitoxin system prevent-host-death family antitoxin [Flexivirga caeni]